MITITALKLQRTELLTSIENVTNQVTAIDALILSMKGKIPKSIKKEIPIEEWVPRPGSTTRQLLPTINRLVKDKEMVPVTLSEVHKACVIQHIDASEESLRAMINKLARAAFLVISGAGHNVKYALTFKGVELVNENVGRPLFPRD
jgi:hypothetical protein